MRYGHETFLPLGAFEPQLGRMRLHGGGGGLDEYLQQQGYEYRAENRQEGDGGWSGNFGGWGKYRDDGEGGRIFDPLEAHVTQQYYNDPTRFTATRESQIGQGINTFNEGNANQKQVVDQINSGKLYIAPRIERGRSEDQGYRESTGYELRDSVTGNVVQNQIIPIDAEKGIFSIGADDPNSSGFFTNIVSTDPKGFVNPITSEQQSQYNSHPNSSANFIRDSIKGIGMMALMASGAGAFTPELAAAEIGTSGLTAAEATTLANSSALADSAMAGAGGVGAGAGGAGGALLASTVSNAVPQVAGQVVGQTAADTAFEKALTESLYGNAGNVGSGLGSTYTGSTLGTALNGLGTAIPSTELALGQGIANAGTLGSIAAPAAAIGGAGTALGTLTGLGGSTAASLAAPAAAGIGSTIGSTLGSLLPTSALGQAALISGLGGIGSAYLGANASEKAADLQSQAASNATQLTRDMFNTQNAQQAPQRAAGYNALNQIQGLLPGQYQQYDAAGNPTTMGTGTGYLTQQMTPSDYQNYLSPYYQFGLNQGLGQASNQANALGGRVGGNALQGLNQYAQNYAQTGAQQAFNNFRNQRTDIYNTLAGIAGIGQTAQSQTNQLAQNAATNQANLGVGSAGAQAAGQIGQANAYSGALGNIGNNFMLASLLNQKGSIF